MQIAETEMQMTYIAEILIRLVFSIEIDPIVSIAMAVVIAGILIGCIASIVAVDLKRN